MNFTRSKYLGKNRVRITYGDAFDKSSPNENQGQELPFVVGVLADFSGRTEENSLPLAEQDFETVTAGGLDSFMKRKQPTATLVFPNPATDMVNGDNIEIQFTPQCLGDFQPRSLMETVPPLSGLSQMRSERMALREQAATGPEADEETIQIAALDQALSALTDAILHHQAFQKLETTWVGLNYLLTVAQGNPQIRIKCLDCTNDDLRADLCTPGETIHADLPGDEGRLWDNLRQSALYNLIHTKTYGQYGGEPFAILLSDAQFDHAGDNVLLLDRIARVLQASYTLFMAGAAPSFFGYDSFAELGDMGAPLFSMDEEGQPQYRDWQALRGREHGRHLSLAMPRVVARRPHDTTKSGASPSPYRENCSVGAEHWLWMSAAFPLAARAIKAFDAYGWCAAMTGLETGGLVQDLPRLDENAHDTLAPHRLAAEVAITIPRERQLTDMGLTALVDRPLGEGLVFLSAPSVFRPPDTSDGISMATTRVPYVLSVSRIGHYIKVIMRNHLGEFHSRIDLERLLNRWLAQYISAQDDASAEVRAARPLRDGQILIHETNDAETFRAEIYLTPHYQFSGGNFEIKLNAMSIQ